MRTRLFIAIAHFCILTTGWAQDYHFSQFDANPFYINPALTGERLTDYKGIQFNANARGQIAQYTKSPSSYNSVAVGADEPINSKFSLGQYVYDNKSSTGSFNTFGFILSGAHKIIDQSADNQVNHNLSVGIQFGIMNSSISPGKLTYDAQYSVNSSDGFDRSIPSGETFARQSYFNFNVNFGVYYRVTSKNKKLSAFGGFSIYNITQPNQSFLGNGTYSPLPLRFNLHGGAICQVTKLLSVVPQLLYMNQAKATELNISTLLFYKLEGTFYEVIYGLGVRNKDAVIFQSGLRVKGIVFRISYDLITNYQKPYRNKGLEFSLVYTLKKRSKNTGTQQESAPSIPSPPQP